MSVAADSCARAKKLILEALFVAVVGVVLGFTANTLSPRGLVLSRNYFPDGTNAAPQPPNATTSPRAATNSNSSAPYQTPIAVYNINGKGLQLIECNQASRLFHGRGWPGNLAVFIDARDEEHFLEGHIPGAYQFDPYHPEKHLPAVLPICTNAEQVVVYCTGGECEDSEFAAIQLRDAGISNQKLFVFTGGITEWTTNNLPLEIGVRGSGNPRKPSK